MKHLLHIFITIVCMSVVAGCADESRLRSDIDRACLMADSCPDSALALLDSLEPLTVDASRGTLMRYNLMLVKARDKAYIIHENDSLIAPVAEYFTAHTDDRLTPIALYYAGRVYSDLGDAPRALEYYQQTVNVLPKNEIYLKSFIYAQIGDLFYSQRLFEYALIANKEYLNLSYRLNDTISIIDGLKELAHTYTNLNKKDSAVICYKKAHSLSQKIEDNELSESLLAQYAYLQNSLGNTEIADSLIEKASMDNDYPTHFKSALYSIISDIYILRGKTNQALPYLVWLCDSGTIYAKKSAYRDLALYSEQNEKWIEASNYNKKAFSLVDSINIEESAQAVARVKANYDYTLYRSENSDLKVKNANKTKIICILIAGFILLAFSLFFWWKSMQMKSQHQIEQLNNIKILHAAETEKVLKEKAKTTEELHKKISNLLLENRSSNDKINSLTKYIFELETTLSQTASQLEDLTRSKLISDNKLMSSDIVDKIKRNISDNNFSLSHNDWKALEKSIILNCPNFYNTMRPDRFMSALEWKVTMLVKIDVSPSNISKITNRSKENITSVRSRLYIKVFKVEKASARDWDEFIRSL